MYSLTMFKNLYDNKTHKRMDFGTFAELERLLYQLAEIPRQGKRDAQLISPATFTEDTTRANKNVVDWGGWAAVDVDDHVFEGNLEQELKDRYGDYYFICYSTASSTINHPKFRLVFPLTERVEQDRIKGFWFALNAEIDSIGDKQTKDLSRMYFIPGSYAGSHNFIFTNSGGRYMDPSELIAKHPCPIKNDGQTFLDRLPDTWVEMILQTRKDQMDNVNVTWSSYRDCPFWPRKLAQEYMMISDTGWYRKMYSIMVATAGNAVRHKYPITANEIVTLCQEFDKDTGNWYENRPMQVEADRAIEFIYKNGM